MEDEKFFRFSKAILLLYIFLLFANQGATEPSCGSYYENTNSNSYGSASVNAEIKMSYNYGKSCTDYPAVNYAKSTISCSGTGDTTRLYLKKKPQNSNWGDVDFNCGQGGCNNYDNSWEAGERDITVKPSSGPVKDLFWLCYSYEYSGGYWTWTTTGLQDSKGHNVNQHANSPSNPSPSNGQTFVSTSPELSIDVSDPDGDSLDVVFRDANGNYIGADYNVPDGGEASTTWDSADSMGTTYNWYAVVEDDPTNFEVQSSSYSFTTVPNNPPDSPVNIAPEDNQEEVSTNPVLEVHVDDNDNDLMDVRFYTGSGDYIDTDYNVCSSCTASVDWNNLNTGSSYSWYAVADDGNDDTRSDTWSFDTKSEPNSPNNPSPLDGEDTVPNSTDLEAQFTHPGGNSMNARFYLDDGSGYSQVGSTQTATDGETVSVSPNLDEGSQYDWYAEAESQGVTKTSSTWSFTTNYNPDIQSTAADPGDESHSIFFSSELNDGDGRNDIDSCTLTVSDSDGDSETFDITPDPGGTANKANCDQNVSYNDNSGWSHTETLDFELEVQDQNGLSDIATETETFPNHRPEIADLEFSSYADIRAFNVTLDVTDSDNGQEEIDKCEFTFTDTEGTSITVSDEINVDNSYGVTDLTRCRYSNVNASMPYPSTLEDGFEPGEKIDIDATAYDLHGESATETDNWTIPLVDEGNFLTETSLDFDYSSVQMTASETEILEYQISNTNRFSQNIRVYLEGMNATFENNETSQDLMVAPFSNRNIEVIVSPQNTGKGILNFTVEHTNLGYNQTVKTPVNIRSSPRTLSTREVSGIGFFQLIMLVLLASYLYSVRP